MKFSTGLTVMVLAIITLIIGVILAINNQTGAAVVCLLVGFGFGFGAWINTDTQ